jgi:hypothetical protein
MNLTNQKSQCNIRPVTAKSVTGIEAPMFTGVSTPNLMCFFYARYMAGCMGQPSGWRFPVNRSFNPVQSATIQIEACGGGKLTFTGDHHV